MSSKFLEDIADILSGYPFRASLPDVSEGDVFALQLKDISDSQKIDWPNVTKANFPPKARRKPDFLIDGDIIFSTKGRNYKATLIENCPENTVCTPQFFHIRLHNPSAIDPAYVVWYINQDSVQKGLTKTQGGVALTTIRKEMVQKIPVTVPSIDLQKKLLDLQSLFEEEKACLEQLIINRKKSLDWVSQEVFKKYRDKE